MRNSSIDLRLRKKAVQMVNDIADWLLEENVAPLDFPLLWSPIFFESVVSLLSSSDIDLQEKVGLILEFLSVLCNIYSGCLLLTYPLSLAEIKFLHFKKKRKKWVKFSYFSTL